MENLFETVSTQEATDDVSVWNEATAMAVLVRNFLTWQVGKKLTMFLGHNHKSDGHNTITYAQYCQVIAHLFPLSKKDGYHATNDVISHKKRLPQQSALNWWSFKVKWKNAWMFYLELRAIRRATCQLAPYCMGNTWETSPLQQNKALEALMAERKLASFRHWHIDRVQWIHFAAIWCGPRRFPLARNNQDIVAPRFFSQKFKDALFVLSLSLSLRQCI